MDTVYGTKKYFQSLSGASDIYRTQACRMTNDYTYQSSLGRRSQLGAYYHMNKQPSYTNDLSITNQYGYNTWGIWRDGRNIPPSKFSEKTHTHYQKNRSFSIILTTAAFIVLLAVIAIAGLAFYFSSIKTNIENPILGFEGSFRIAKGDLFSTGLKYNHTTTYKQKIDFYRRFVERALSDNALHTLRTDIWGFGDGPLIKVSFRVFLDVRKLPQNIHSVEEYIKESLFLATTATKSLYRSLRLDAESIEIKRIIDEQIVNSAAILKEAQTVPTSQTQLEKRLTKKAGATSGLQTKSSQSHSSTLKPRGNSRPHIANEEPDVDVENAPVIQGSFEGSFEITKTDADISRKKAAPTRAYHSISSTSSSSSSLSPKAVTPYTLRVKPKKPGIEKLTTIEPQHPTKTTTTMSTKPPSTTRATKRTTTTPTTTARTTTSTTPTTTTTTPKPTTKPKPSTTTPTTTTSTSTTESTAIAFSTPSTPLPVFNYPSSTKVVPKLDANLFTTIPILDTQPWRPIHREVPELLPGPPPAFPTIAVGAAQHSSALPSSSTTLPADLQQLPPQRRIDEFELPFIADSPQPPALPPSFDTFATGFFNNVIRKPEAPKTENETQPPDVLVYHSFGSPIYDPDTENIERLGAGAHVQPHPLPVQLIDDVIIPPFKPLNPTLGTIEKLPFSIDAGDEKFEHLGGGVIVKKHSNSTVKPKPGTAMPVELTERHSATTTLSTDLNTPDFGEPTTTTTATTTITTTTTQQSNLAANKPLADSQLADTIGEFFMELLNLPKEDNLTSVVDNTTIDIEPLESRIIPDESTHLPDPKPTTTTTKSTTTKSTTTTSNTTTSTTAKPSFLNLKEIVLRRKDSHNQETVETTPKPKPTRASMEQPTTTKRNRIRPASKRPAAIFDDSSLFPSHSKWQFVNSSSATAANVEHASNMRKVFNKTLQAWVSEDVEKTENLTLNDIKNRINNATNIQDISLIFDTLASKLGITPSVPTKFPPFSQNKLKHTQKNEAKLKPITTTTTTSTTTNRMPTPAPTSPPLTTLGSVTTTTKNFIELQLQHREPFIKPMSSFMTESSDSSEVLGAAIPVVGEAEVEIIDPTKYEEMLKSSQFAEPTTTEISMHKLVTLLPVRSNSGIRTYNKSPATHTADGGGGESEARSQHAPSLSKVSIRRKLNTSQTSRRFSAPPAEAIVKGGLKVTVK